MTEQINKGLKSILSMETDYFGFVFEDGAVWQTVKKGIPYLPSFDQGMTDESLRRIADRIVRFLNRPVENSTQLLLQNKPKLYQDHAKQEA